jgi:hypothetical protein
MGSPTISSQKLLAASQGNPDLLEVLRSIQGVSNLQQAVTGTTPTAAPVAGQPNPAAPVPPQATGTASLLGTSYVVQIVNPGATSPISQLQSQQQTANATPLTPLQPVKAIFHQIRASTSPAFNVNSNTQTFGGNTGSAQVYWTLTGLGSGTWFFQFRSSYDGINFNTWKNVNGGTALGGLVNEVTVETVGDATWALFTLPGSLVVGVGAAEVADGGLLGIPTQVYSSGMVAIAGPNGPPVPGSSAYGVLSCDVDIQTPVPLPPLAGIADFPVEIRMQYGEASGAAPVSGDASVFAIAFDPSNPNVKIYSQTTTTWTVLQLPGGARIAIGQGTDVDGAALWVPPALTWFSWSRSMSISSFTQATNTGNTPHGFYTNQIAGGVLSAQYSDETHIWSTTANWVAIAWQAGTDVLTVGGHPFLQIQLQGTHSVVIGAGQTASGTPIVLPTGFTSAQMLSMCTPASFTPAGHHFSGIATCAMFGLTPNLSYIDSSANVWSGSANWMVCAWR